MADTSSPPLTQQPKTIEWHQQWVSFANDADFQFHECIAPATLETFRGKNVLECGCGGGNHTFLVAEVARTVTAVDLNTASLARGRNLQFTNIEFKERPLIHWVGRMAGAILNCA